MITTASAAFVLEEDSQQQFLGARILCEPTFRETEAKFSVRLNVLDSTTSHVIHYGYIEVTSAEVDAETGSGTGEVDQWWNALQKAVKTKLAAIPDNSGVTFTVI
jgi:hypothetical protein